jgi:hypothetical protein
MKIYKGNTINNSRHVLRRTKDENVLYVSHYYFAVSDGNNLIFYYNPHHFWEKVSNKSISFIAERLFTNANHFYYLFFSQIFLLML